MQRYHLGNALSSIWGNIFQLFLFLKAYFQNILASGGVCEGVCVWGVREGGEVTQYSVFGSLVVTTVRGEICKEISISIIYNKLYI